MTNHSNSNSRSIVLPGDHLKIDNEAENKVKIGPGLLQDHHQVVAVKAGILKNVESGNRYWVENRQKRYIPSVGDAVVGIVMSKGAENYRVDIGGPHPAVLPVLAFEGATKRNRPILEIRSLVYARVSFAHRDIEPELECINPSTQRADGYGELKKGYCFKCSLSLARSLFNPQNKVLKALSQYFPFETAIGLNGMVWINAEHSKQTVVAMNAIRNTEFMTSDQQIKNLVKEYLKLLDDDEDMS